MLSCNVLQLGSREEGAESNGMAVGSGLRLFACLSHCPSLTSRLKFTLLTLLLVRLGTTKALALGRKALASCVEGTWAGVEHGRAM